MDCRGFRDILDFYLDGELRVRTMHEVRAHLDDCSDCRNETIAWCGLLERLRRACQRIVIHSDCRERIRQRLHQEIGLSRTEPIAQ